MVLGSREQLGPLLIDGNDFFQVSGTNSLGLEGHGLRTFSWGHVKDVHLILYSGAMLRIQLNSASVGSLLNGEGVGERLLLGSMNL